MDKTKIRIEGLYKIFGGHPAQAMKLIKQGVDNQEVRTKTKQSVGVVDVNFEVFEGETLVIMGLSGSGKSTLIRCINRLISPTSGKVYVDDTDVTSLDEKELIEVRRKKFGMVFQHFGLFPHRTIVDNAAFGLEVQQIEREVREKRALEALELVGLSGWESAYPSQLSGGMQQRVGLARALAIDPDVLLMDEAFSALDPLIRTEMQDELLSLESQVKKTIVFITHDLDEALKMGDRIVLMKDGRVVQIGTPEEILTKPANEYVQKFLENVDYTKVLTAEDVLAKPKTVTAMKDGPATALRAMKNAGLPGIFVVNHDRILQGYLTVERATEAAQHGQAHFEELLEKLDVPSVEPDTPLRDIFTHVANTKHPVAVVDGAGKLKGVVHQSSIIAALAERGEYYV